MSATVIPLDDWHGEANWFAEALAVAERAGPGGFTADDLKVHADLHGFDRPRNPGSVLGALVAQRRLVLIGGGLAVAGAVLLAIQLAGGGDCEC